MKFKDIKRVKILGFRMLYFGVKAIKITAKNRDLILQSLKNQDFSQLFCADFSAGSLIPTSARREIGLQIEFNNGEIIRVQPTYSQKSDILQFQGVYLILASEIANANVELKIDDFKGWGEKNFDAKKITFSKISYEKVDEIFGINTLNCLDAFCLDGLMYEGKKLDIFTPQITNWKNEFYTLAYVCDENKNIRYKIGELENYELKLHNKSCENLATLDEFLKDSDE